MKTDVIGIQGEKIKTIELPKVFDIDENIREDIVQRVIETKKTKKPYSPKPEAGNQYSASGKIVHRRHVWKGQYGRGISRIPRKIMLRRGRQIHWIGATIPSAVGGRRAHPPKSFSMINTKKINKREVQKALYYSISATANEDLVKKRYVTLKNEKIEKKFPIVVDSKITTLKVKELLKLLKNFLGKKLYRVAIKKKKVRSGKGKLRGRKYKSNWGALIVLGKNERLKTKIVETKQIDKLGVADLSKGGLGRLTIYTEQAIIELGEKLK